MRADAAGGVIKVAVTPPTFAACARLRQVVDAGTEQVVIGMGPAGVVTRVCPWIWQSMWTYGGSAAPGQLPAADLIDLYRARQTGPSTRIFALVGSPLGHSASPAMHNRALASSGLDAVYVPVETGDAADFLEGADAIGVEGASVTAPLKTGWAALGVQVDAAGRAIGAVNTLRRTGGGLWEARNFDVQGFLAPLIRRGHGLTGRRAVVLGAGGAARAVAWTLTTHGASVEVAARRAEAAAQLGAEFGVAAAAWPPAPGWDLLVNATPVGTWPHTGASAIDPACVRGRIVYDLVYNPAETALLRAARESGAETIGGLEMLVGQAQAQFEFWTGVPAPAGVMEQAAAAFLHREAESE
jgi:shikimate dehydrogenase